MPKHTQTATSIYAITDSTLMPLSQFNYKAEQALQAGVKWIQYRDKSGDKTKRMLQAKALMNLCEKYSAKLIINDDIALAAQISAHGVHLGQNDGDIASARAFLGEHAIIGSTCHDQIELAHAAKKQGASYIAFGRFFASQTKPNAKPAPLPLIKKARKLALPVVVIGGITARNTNQLILAGADTVAICHDIFNAQNIEQRVTKLHQIATHAIKKR